MEKIKVRIKKAPKMQSGGASVTPTNYGFPEPNNPYWKQHPLFTEHTDGTYRHWGEDMQKDRINAIFNTSHQDIPPMDPRKPPVILSDKARGYSNTYTPSRNQQQGADVPTIHSNYNRKYGGQLGYGLDLGRNKYTMPKTDPAEDVNKTIKPVKDPRTANIEAEKGESIVGDFGGDGNLSQLNIGGKKHYAGGTPLQVPDNSFVFSDTKKMQMGGAEVIPFGKTPGKKLYTPADLAKQYDITKYTALLNDPKSDPITKRTAELMIQNYEGKLGALSLVQEAKKGFPDGIPELASDYLQQFLAPDVPTSGNIQQKTDNTNPGSQMRYGGSFQSGGNYQTNGLLPGQESSYLYDTNPPYKGQIVDNKSIGTNYQSHSRVPITAPAKSIPDYLKKRPAAINAGDTPETGLSSNKFYSNDKVSDPVIPQSGYTPQDYTDPNAYTNQPNQATFSNQSNVPFDYLAPDKMSYEQAIINRAGLHKYMPWEPPIQAYTPSPTFYDPSRELAANEESQNAQMQTDAMFSGPQNVSSRNSQIAGQAAGQAANTISKYDQENVGVANQFSNMNSEIMNKEAQEREQASQALYTGNTIANQEWDNARMKLDNELLAAKTNAWNNRATIGAINSTNPYYYEDPNTGKITFTGEGNSLMAKIRTGESSSDPVLELKTLRDRLMRESGLTSEQAYTEASKMMAEARTRTTYKGLNQIPTQTVKTSQDAFQGQQYSRGGEYGAYYSIPGQY